MADVSHELGSLRFVVDSPLSSKVAMFNNQANQHVQSQLLNPFSNNDGRCSPKPQFSKDEYGKPLAGSLTEMRGQKANIHVMKEMLELCQIIDSEGYSVKDEPSMRVIPFGELFNIYNYISDKVVGILLRARKHKLVQFEGEMLFQRRDDDVPVFLLRPIQEIRKSLEVKIEEIKRASSPLPQATSVLLDKSAQTHKRKDVDASVRVPSFSCSPSPSPAPSVTVSRAPTPSLPVTAPEILVTETEHEIEEETNILRKSEATTDALLKNVEAEPTTGTVTVQEQSCESTEKPEPAEQTKQALECAEPKTEITTDPSPKYTEPVAVELPTLTQSVENSSTSTVETSALPIADNSEDHNADVNNTSNNNDASHTLLAAASTTEAIENFDVATAISSESLAAV